MTISDTILLECEYMPCIRWFSELARYERMIIEQMEHFEKATLRNRCYVAGPTGAIMLSIPVEGGRNHKNIMKDVRISYHERWQHVHWQTIISCYGRAPYFEYYAEYLQPLYSERPNFLMDFNLNCLKVVMQLLQWNKPFELSQTYNKETTMTDIRTQFKASNYDSFTTKPYHQVFSTPVSFIHNLSILDLLLCEGRQAGHFL